MARTLNSQLLRVLSALTLAAFAIIHFGWYIYWNFVYDWLFPGIADTDQWNRADFSVLGVILAIGLTGTAFVGWLLADFNAMAERLERAEAELKYSNSAIAHELRTPLTIL